MYGRSLAVLVSIVMVCILVGEAIWVFSGPIIYIVEDSHERCMEVH